MLQTTMQACLNRVLRNHEEACCNPSTWKWLGCYSHSKLYVQESKPFNSILAKTIKESVKSGGGCLTLGGSILCQAEDMDWCYTK